MEYGSKRLPHCKTQRNNFRLTSLLFLGILSVQQANSMEERTIQNPLYQYSKNHTHHRLGKTKKSRSQSAEELPLLTTKSDTISRKLTKEKRARSKSTSNLFPNARQYTQLNENGNNLDVSTEELFKAIQSKNPYKTHLALKKANVNATHPKTGNTPLIETIETLQRHRTKKSSTKKSIVVLALLLGNENRGYSRKSADLTVENYDNKTADSLAEQYNMPILTTALRSAQACDTIIKSEK